ncbi:MAG: hypothetical protein EOO41_04055, partial [Methanobacteriota archaeon]
MPTEETRPSTPKGVIGVASMPVAPAGAAVAAEARVAAASAQEVTLQAVLDAEGEGSSSPEAYTPRLGGGVSDGSWHSYGSDSTDGEATHGIMLGDVNNVGTTPTSGDRRSSTRIRFGADRDENNSTLYSEVAVGASIASGEGVVKKLLSLVNRLAAVGAAAGRGAPTFRLAHDMIAATQEVLADVQDAMKSSMADASVTALKEATKASEQRVTNAMASSTGVLADAHQRLDDAKHRVIALLAQRHRIVKDATHRATSAAATAVQALERAHAQLQEEKAVTLRKVDAELEMAVRRATEHRRAACAEREKLLQGAAAVARRRGHAGGLGGLTSRRDPGADNGRDKVGFRRQGSVDCSSDGGCGDCSSDDSHGSESCVSTSTLDGSVPSAADIFSSATRGTGFVFITPPPRVPSGNVSSASARGTATTGTTPSVRTAGERMRGGGRQLLAAAAH